MKKYVLDTALLIRALRSGAEADRMYRSLSASVFYISSVVAHEMLAGAHDHELQTLHRRVITPFERLGRLVTPTHQAWKDAGRILYKLRSAGWQINSSFTNDVLIAVSATQVGATLLHDNARDFDAIKNVYPKLTHHVGWPERAAA